ncbi:hypothetical protein HPP92_018278 [Vanilla planifolia]|uniref:SBP-type domain-containing protein n=1 Tax=Vanilla planifolia TaxID=51239 RepID=A0A835Q9I3_VANPL|nr:hypothetical protein HPP92_018278 [Vanilla planifolia]
MEGGEVDAPPVFFHSQGLFSDCPPMAKKRDLPWENTGFHHGHQLQNNHPWPIGSMSGNSTNWNQNMWDWDCVMFTAKPSENVPEVLCLSAQDAAGVGNSCGGGEQRKASLDSANALLLGKEVEDEGENLVLKLGGGAYAFEEPVARTNKRARSGSNSGSPGDAGRYPMCQVDDCKADLSNAKDYHRRHKVCELHSKTAKAFVGKQMQRFCQQCSRFHPLTEFDEGKRSCRRRLAGHNRRRRKTQTDDASTNLASGNQDVKANGSVDILNLLAILARLQGSLSGKPTSMPSLPNRDQLVQLLDKFSPLHSAKVSSKMQLQSSFDLNVLQPPQQVYSEQTPKESGKIDTPSTMNLLSALSTALGSSNVDVLATLTQSSSPGDGKNMEAYQETLADVNSRRKLSHSSPSFGSIKTDINVNSGFDSLETMPKVPLQLFGSVLGVKCQPGLDAAEDDSPSKLGSASKYPSSESSNPIDDISPSCSPPIAKRLFPLHSAFEKKDESMSICREDPGTAEASTTYDWATSIEPLKGFKGKLGSQVVQNSSYPAGYLSSSGSDLSPTSNSDVQNRTGRIIFKLFDKDPSNLPETLRADILNWLSHSPSDIESYIRPGCVVLSIYISMASIAWDELEEDFFQRVNSLVHCSDSGFWKSGRFVVRSNKQLASHKNGKIRSGKFWRAMSSPVLTSISPIAVVNGQETTILLRGRNLSAPGTKIHCMYMGGCKTKEVICSTADSCSESFVPPTLLPCSYGRYFIEVDNGFRGNSFPVIVADAAICQELRSLESVFVDDDGARDSPSEDQYLDDARLPSQEDVIHFLNELGWLFQRKSHSDSSLSDFSVFRFKYLFAFSVDREFCVLVKTLLDLVVERSCTTDSALSESMEMLLELQLLSRAVKRRCRKIVDLLLNYSVKNAITKDSSLYLFAPNSIGPGGLTPLHLAASMQDADDMVDALTTDPQEIGLNCWSSVLDDLGVSPSMYASSRNNHSYNNLVARKAGDKKNGQVSIMVQHEELSTNVSWIKLMSPTTHSACHRQALSVTSCVRCALLESRNTHVSYTGGLLRRPYILCMLAVAAVCVCVCVFLRGAPFVGSVAPFEWEKLEFGPI